MAVAGSCALVAFQLGRFVIGWPGMAVNGALAVLAGAAALTASLPTVLLAFPAAFVARRFGPGALNMSIADLTLVLATVAALPFVPWRNATVWRALGAIVVYQALIALTVVAHPNQRTVFEWAHRGVILAGGLVVGAAVAHHGRTVRAVRLLCVAASVVATAAIAQSLGSGLRPAYPLALQKNFAGGLMAMTFIVVWVRPELVAVGPRALSGLRALLLGGILGTQSRGAMVGLSVALLIWSLAEGKRTARVVLLIPAGLAIACLAAYSLHVDEQRPNTDFTSRNSRRIANAAAAQQFQANTIFGAGLRYFREPGYRFDVRSYRTNYIEPHSVWYSTLAETGLIGLAALVLLVAMVLRALQASRGPLALLAALLLVARLVHSIWDIFWVGGIQTLPWLFVGLAAATVAVDARADRDVATLPAPPLT